MALGQKLFEENGIVTGFNITKVHPTEGLTMEVSFTSEIKGIGRFPSGKNLGSGTMTQYPHGIVDASWKGVLTTAEGEQFVWWAHEKDKVVGSGEVKGLTMLTGFTNSQKLSWMNNLIMANESEFDPDSQKISVTGYEWPFIVYTMPIDSDFPKNHQTIGKHKHSDGEHYHFVWGPGRSDAETATKPEVQEAYKARDEQYGPLGVHGTMVAVDWDSCYADGACIEACPVQVFQWYRTEDDIPAIELANATSAGTGEDHDREGRKDYTDKSDPIREHDCIWCMACVSVCPPQAIKVDQANLEYHERASGTFNKELAKGSAPPPHAH